MRNIEFTEDGFRILKDWDMIPKNKGRYWQRRFTLSFIWILLPVGFMLFLFGYYLDENAKQYITPKSVHVRGYYRSDGTYIRPYTRRPPGSVPHDSPYETKIFIGELTQVAGVVIAVIGLIRFLFVSPLTLLPRIKMGGRRIRYVYVPLRHAYARKDWSCIICSKPIYSGSSYFYNHSDSDRDRHCIECREFLKNMYQEWRKIRIEQLKAEFTIEVV